MLACAQNTKSFVRLLLRRSMQPHHTASRDCLPATTPTCQPQAHEHAGMGVVGGLGLVVHNPGSGQAAPSWSQPDACNIKPFPQTHSIQGQVLKSRDTFQAKKAANASALLIGSNHTMTAIHFLPQPPSAMMAKTTLRCNLLASCSLSKPCRYTLTLPKLQIQCKTQHSMYAV